MLSMGRSLKSRPKGAWVPLQYIHKALQTGLYAQRKRSHRAPEPGDHYNSSKEMFVLSPSPGWGTRTYTHLNLQADGLHPQEGKGEDHTDGDGSVPQAADEDKGAGAEPQDQEGSDGLGRHTYRLK